MKGLILSGGRGTRLRPLTHTRAKQLVPIANKANIDYAIEDLLNAGIDNIGIVISPETGDEVRIHIQKRQYKAKFTFIEQEYPGGLAHAVLVSKDFLGNEPFVMYLGDNILDGGIGHLLDSFHKTQADACILLTRVENPENFGVAVLDNKGFIQKLVEKPKEFISDLALVGVYLFTPKILSIIENLKPSKRGELEITEAIQGVIEIGANVEATQTRGWWKDTGKPEDLLEANRLALLRLQTNLLGTIENSEIVGLVHIDATATIKNSKIVGPVIIGANSNIDQSTIGPYVSLSNGVKIEKSRLENSILLDNVVVKDVNLISNSILGEESELIGSGYLQFFLGDRSKVRI